MDIKEIRQELIDCDSYVVVKGKWYFNQYSMQCEDSYFFGEDCCNDDFSSVEEALANVLDYADNDLANVKLY